MKMILFNQIDREIILWYYNKYPKGNYWKKPSIVSIYELLKAKKEFAKSIQKSFTEFIEKIIKLIKI